MRKKLQARKPINRSFIKYSKENFEQKLEIENIQSLIELMRSILEKYTHLKPEDSQWNAADFRKLGCVINECQEFDKRAEYMDFPAWKTRMDSALRCLGYLEDLRKTPTWAQYQETQAVFETMLSDIENLCIWKYEEQSRPSVRSSKSIIFILEDNSLFADTIALQLQNQGFDVEVFDSILEIQKASQLVKPDLVLVDLNLNEGKLAGIDYLVQLNGRVPSIVMSSRFDIKARLKAMRAGVSGYVTKPVDMDFLNTLICQNLEMEMEKQTRALIIDDDELTALTYSKFLEEYNIDTRALTDASKMLDALSENKPDIIFMDIKMPYASGYELGKIIQQVYGEDLAPEIVYMTGAMPKSESYDYDHEDLQDAGVLLKPLEPLQMANVVEFRVAQKGRAKNNSSLHWD